MTRNFARMLLPLALMWAGAAPLASAQAPETPAPVAASPAPITTPPAAAIGPGGFASALNANYVLGSGDRVRVIVYGETSLTGEFFVSPQGVVSYPLIGEVQAAGRTLPQFIADIEGRLKQGYVNEPRVSAEVLSYRPFYILGEVTRPGTYPYSSDMTVMNAVATAGGYTYRANRGNVFIKRMGETTEQKIKLRPDTMVAPGDTVRIGERLF
jgi:protein involved in polysaccharide export with SLBB domain